MIYDSTAGGMSSSQVEELRSHMLRGTAKIDKFNLKKKRKIFIQFLQFFYKVQVV